MKLAGVVSIGSYSDTDPRSEATEPESRPATGYATRHVCRRQRCAVCRIEF